MYQPPQEQPGIAAKKPGMPIWVIVLIVCAGCGVVGIPILASVAIYGVRKYIAAAKTAEARNTLGQIGLLASRAFEKNHAICGSATRAVPADTKLVKGTKYMSAPSEWTVDEGRKAGFACLGLSLATPQYYQYSYHATPNGKFEAIAHGDLNGDGVLSTFVLRGEVRSGLLSIAPTLEEKDPYE